MWKFGICGLSNAISLIITNYSATATLMYSLPSAARIWFTGNLTLARALGDFNSDEKWADRV
jgi:hypothetical protein